MFHGVIRVTIAFSILFTSLPVDTAGVRPQNVSRVAGGAGSETYSGLTPAVSREALVPPALAFYASFASVLRSRFFQLISGGVVAQAAAHAHTFVREGQNVRVLIQDGDTPWRVAGDLKAAGAEAARTQLEVALQLQADQRADFVDGGSFLLDVPALVKSTLVDTPLDYFLPTTRMPEIPFDRSLLADSLETVSVVPPEYWLMGGLVIAFVVWVISTRGRPLIRAVQSAAIFLWAKPVLRWSLPAVSLFLAMDPLLAWTESYSPVTWEHVALPLSGIVFSAVFSLTGWSQSRLRMEALSREKITIYQWDYRFSQWLTHSNRRITLPLLIVFPLALGLATWTSGWSLLVGLGLIMAIATPVFFPHIQSRLSWMTAPVRDPRTVVPQPIVRARHGLRAWEKQALPSASASTSWSPVQDLRDWLDHRYLIPASELARLEQEFRLRTHRQYPSHQSLRNEVRRFGKMVRSAQQKIADPLNPALRYFEREWTMARRSYRHGSLNTIFPSPSGRSWTWIARERPHAQAALKAALQVPVWVAPLRRLLEGPSAVAWPRWPLARLIPEFGLVVSLVILVSDGVRGSWLPVSERDPSAFLSYPTDKLFHQSA